MFFRAALKRLAGGVILASALTAAPAMAQQGVPQGSYLESCRQVQVRWGKDLAAFCATRAGEWVVSRLDDFPSCDGDIANRNGQLVCRDMPAPGSLYGTLAPPPPPRPQPPAPPPVVQRPPAGTYTSSCRDLKLEGSWLSATCRDGWGNWRETGLSLTGCPLGTDISNVEGRLACRSFTSQHAGDYPPPGSYMASCRDIRVVAGWLKASCQDRNGRWSEATTAVSWCSPGRDIANDNGRLTCR